MTAASAGNASRAPESHTGGICVDGGGLIARFESGWLIRVGYEQIELPPETLPTVAAEQFAKLCEAVKGADKRCVLGLPTGECFFANFQLPDSIDAKDRGAVTFELERHFPLDAESMVADFCVPPPANQIAAVGIETRRQRGTVDALQDAGIEVVSIVPTSFLIARSMQRWRDGQSRFTLLLFGQSSVESLSIDAEGVHQWRQFYGSDDELHRHQTITAETVDAHQTIVIVGRKELGFRPIAPVQWCNLPATELAAESANLALGGRWGRWPDLRRGDLAPGDPLFAVAGPLRNLALATTFCLLIVAIAAWYRGSRIASESESVRQQQRMVFTTAYPDRRVPVMLMRTVRSEHSKTLGSRGRGDAIKIPIPATTVLQDFYRGLDHAQRIGGARFRLIDVKILDGECSFTVRAVDAVQIGTIAKSLETLGFQVAPPASEQIDPSKDEPMPTYQSTITAVWNAMPNDSEKGIGS